MAKQVTEEQIEQLIEKLVEKMQRANELFLSNIGEKIKKIKNLKPSEAHKLIQILKYGGNYEDIIKKISKVSQMNIKELDKIFEDYSKKDMQFAEDFYKYRNIPLKKYNENSALKKQTEAFARMAKQEMYDFTRENVLGYTIRDSKGNITFKGLREVYNEVLDEAFISVGQGKDTFDSAMRRILKDIGDSGLKTIDYKSGRSVRLDSAITMHLRNRLSELHNENQRLFGEEYDSDGIEISVHLNPAPDHQDVQGRQFSNEEYDKLQKGLEAKDYKGKSYSLDHDENGSYRPISEMNCYHYIFSIILGVNEPEYNDKQLKKIIDNNNKGFEFEGKHYSMYEGTQLQRGIEREIRKQKDIQILAKASGNDELVADSQERITILTYKYKDLCDTSGLLPKKKRLTVSGYKRTKINPVDNSTAKPVVDLKYSALDNYDFSKIRENIENKSLDDLWNNFETDEFYTEYNKFYKTLDEEEIKEYLDEYKKWTNNGAKNSHPIGKFLNKKLHYDKKSELIDEKEFWIDEDGEQVRDGQTYLLDENHWYRGISSVDAHGDNHIRKVTEYIDDFKYGDYYAGQGVNGNGTYATNSFRRAWEYSESDERGIIYIMPKDNINMIEINKMRYVRRHINENKKKLFVSKNKTYEEFSEIIFNDEGYIASILGYDIIDVGEDKVILNRNSIKVVK